MNTLALTELGWQPFFEQQVSPEERNKFLIARVGAHFGGRIQFLSDVGRFSVPTSLVELENIDFASDHSHEFSVSGIAIGDWFLLDKIDHRAIRQLERKTLISRKAAGNEVKSQLIASNIDTAIIVSSCNQDFNLSRIERYLALVLESGIVPVVVLTKSDICDDPNLLRRQTEKLHAGLLVETMDARDLNQVAVLNDWCSTGKTIALLGSSGVGKSTLANALGDHDIETSGIREDDAKGRHTTTARSMHRLLPGGWLVDNPGMREFQLPACEQGLADLFDDIIRLAKQCQFRNCHHENEPGCAIQTAIENGDVDERRFISFQKLESEQARNTTSLAERRQKERQIGKFYKRVISEKRSRRR